MNTIYSVLASLLLALHHHSMVVECSIAVSRRATLTLNSFEKGGDGGGPSECDGQYHSDNFLLVALSTPWFNEDNRRRCGKYITINGYGNTVFARVVDECDTSAGCQGSHIVDGSFAVWLALGVPEGSNEWGEMGVTWSDT